MVNSLIAILVAACMLSGYSGAKVENFVSTVPTESVQSNKKGETSSVDVGIEFKDYDGNVILDKSHIKGAKVSFGEATQFGSPEYFITIEFTEEGRIKFKEATEKAVEKIPLGENYILISFNGELISSPMVTTAIDTYTCKIAGSFDKESANKLADMINYGKK
ncbi:MAG: SecDF P1 head subdomain-containing protein [Clostridia bacterium]